MDWYKLWNAEKGLPRPQHYLSIALWVLAVVSLVAGAASFLFAPWVFSLYGVVGALSAGASALALDSLIVSARLLHSIRRELETEARKAEDERLRRRKEAA